MWKGVRLDAGAVNRCRKAGGTTVSVAMAEGRHPVPFRTRKLSPPAPMVLPWRRGGRVGRRRDSRAEGPLRWGGPSLLDEPAWSDPGTNGRYARGGYASRTVPR